MSKKTDGFSKDNTIDINSLRLELVTGEIIDLLNMFQEFNIYVNMHGMGIMANVIFNDTINICNNGPIIGGERIFIRFKSTAYEEYDELMFRVSLQVERVPTGNQSTLVKLELVSEEYYKLLGISISRGYSSQYSSAASKLYAESGVDKPFYVDPSSGLHTFAVPQTLSIVENLQWLANRARTVDGLPFCVFEDVDSFNFVSWSKVISQETKLNLFFQPQLTEETFEKEFRNILSVQFDENAKDALTYRKKGFGGGSEYTYDPSQKSLGVKDQSFKSYSENVPTLDIGKPWLPDLRSEGKSFLLKKVDDSQSNSFFRRALDHSMRLNSLTIVTAGDNRMRLGTVVEIDLISPQAQNMNDAVNERFINGRFLVTSLKHTIRPSEYRLYWGLSKDSYMNKVNNDG